jgi:HEAT repeat protein
VNVAFNITLEVLTKTANLAADEALLPALDAQDRRIQLAALEALMNRRSQVGQLEVLRRWHCLPDDWRPVIEKHRGRMAQALRDAIVGDDQQLAENACQATVWFREYDLLPSLINVAEDSTHANADRCAATLLRLAELLYEELHAKPDYRLRRDPQLVRRNVTSSLENSVQRFVRHHRVEPVEAFLMLTVRENATLLQVLGDPHHPAYLALTGVLTRSSRPAIVRLLLGYLDDPRAPSSLMAVTTHRNDRWFIDLLLRKIGHEPSPGAKTNLKRAESFVWLRDDFRMLDSLDEAAQHSVVQMVTNSGMKPAIQLEVVRHLAACGKTAGRRAAVATLSNFPGADAAQLVLRALDDPDPQVQALSLAQLRSRGIPGALATLVEKIDSPHAVVRHAARASLSEFSFKRFLGAFDMLDESVRRSTGMLVRRIDIQAVPLLKQELLSAQIKRRLRGLEVARAIGAVAQLESTIIELLSSDDHLVRARAALALGDCDSPAACLALREAENDKNIPVQEAAAQSLERIAERCEALHETEAQQVNLDAVPAALSEVEP